VFPRAERNSRLSETVNDGQKLLDMAREEFISVGDGNLRARNEEILSKVPSPPLRGRGLGRGGKWFHSPHLWNQAFKRDIAEDSKRLESLAPSPLPLFPGSGARGRFCERLLNDGVN
jgi:hypothetical protein